MTKTTSNFISKNSSACPSYTSSANQNNSYSLNQHLQHTKSPTSTLPMHNLETINDIDLNILDMSENFISITFDDQFPSSSPIPLQNSSPQNNRNSNSLKTTHQPNPSSFTQSDQIHIDDQHQISSPRRIQHEDLLNLQSDDDSSDSFTNPFTNKHTNHRKRQNSPNLTTNSNLRVHNNEPPPQENTATSRNYNTPRSPPLNQSNHIMTLPRRRRPPTPIPSSINSHEAEHFEVQRRGLFHIISSDYSDDSSIRISISDDDFDDSNSPVRNNSQKSKLPPFLGRLWNNYIVSSQDKDDELCCAICLCDFKKDENVAKLGCDHVFHVDCISSWLHKSGHRPTCPLCRQDLSESFSKKNNNNK